jgi:hypothetical protein
LEDALEAGKDDEALASIVIVDDPELDFAIALLDNSRLRERSELVRKEEKLCKC